MPRIRTIKPSFWSDEKVVELSPLARLLFIGLWNFSDDYGNGEGSRRQIKMRIFPGDNIEIDPLIEELTVHQFIIEYMDDNKKYIHIRNFTKHQRINRVSGEKYPAPPKKKTLTADSPEKMQEGKGSGSGSGSGKEGKGSGSKDSACGIVDNLPDSDGANGGGNALGHPPAAPTPEDLAQADLIRLRIAQGLPASGRKANA